MPAMGVIRVVDLLRSLATASKEQETSVVLDLVEAFALGLVATRSTISSRISWIAISLRLVPVLQRIEDIVYEIPS